MSISLADILLLKPALPPEGAGRINQLEDKVIVDCGKSSSPIDLATKNLFRGGRKIPTPMKRPAQPQVGERTPGGMYVSGLILRIAKMVGDNEEGAPLSMRDVSDELKLSYDTVRGAIGKMVRFNYLKLSVERSGTSKNIGKGHYFDELEKFIAERSPAP